MGLSCQALARGLMRRGHTVDVLASAHADRPETRSEQVHRILPLAAERSPGANVEHHLLRPRTWARQGAEVAVAACRRLRPERAFLFGGWNLPRAVLRAIQQELRGRLVYRFADYWPLLPPQEVAYWSAPGGGATGAMRRAIAPLARLRLDGESGAPLLPLSPSFCVSEAVRGTYAAQGLPLEDTRVIHTGIDLAPFHAQWEGDRPGPAPGRIAYVGRIAPEKGLDNLMDALGWLRDEAPELEWRLALVGNGSADYRAHLRRVAEARGITSRVDWLGRTSPDDIPTLLSRQRVVVIPSVWEDPLPRTAIEGLASRCVVVASRIGGLPEIVDDGETGILVPSGDPVALAIALRGLCESPEAANRMAERGWRAARERFGEERMLDEIEHAFLQPAEGSEWRA